VYENNLLDNKRPLDSGIPGPSRGLLKLPVWAKEGLKWPNTVKNVMSHVMSCVTSCHVSRHASRHACCDWIDTPHAYDLESHASHYVSRITLRVMACLLRLDGHPTSAPVTTPGNSSSCSAQVISLKRLSIRSPPGGGTRGNGRSALISSNGPGRRDCAAPAAQAAAVRCAAPEPAYTARRRPKRK
jgi:hypothetical protein